MRNYKKFQLRDYNSFKLSSIAKEIWFPENFLELNTLVTNLTTKDYKILSGGTNVILKPKIKKLICLTDLPQICNFRKNGITEVSANYNASSFIKKAIGNYYKGFEGLIGLPGTIGGAVVMNAGSGKYTISDYLYLVFTIDEKGISRIYKKEDLNFGRRYSILQDKKEIVEKVVFKLKRGNISKKDYRKAIKHRKLLPKEPSAGGIFKNWHKLKPYSCHLIGSRIGDAEISRYLNIMINKGNATYKDIMDLIYIVEEIVGEKLELEVKII